MTPDERNMALTFSCEEVTEMARIIASLSDNCQIHNSDYNHVTPGTIIDRANELSRQLFAKISERYAEGRK